MVGNFGFLFTNMVCWGDTTVGDDTKEEELFKDVDDISKDEEDADEMSVLEASSEVVDIGDTGGESWQLM